MNHCAKCGAPLPPGAEFCPRCGARLAVAPVAAPTIAPAPVVPPREVVPPPQVVQPQTAPPRSAPPPSAPPPGATHQSAAPPKSRVWWIIPLTLVALGGVIWLLLAGLPFGKEEQVAAPAPMETIGEETSTADNRTVQTATIIEVPSEDELEPAEVATTTTAPPDPPARYPAPARTIPVPTEPVRTMPVRTAPPPRRASEPAPKPAPKVARSGAEISESEAIGTLRSFVTSRNPYGVAANCIGVASRGYKNVGYTLEVVDTCRDSRMLGRWRVDSKTREVFRQREDGRFLRP